MDALRRKQYLDALGLTEWRLRSAPQEEIAEASESIAVEPAPVLSSPVMKSKISALPVTDMDWPELADVVRECTSCRLRAGCTQTVFGVGSRNAELLVIGEGPGADEDRIGEPFVGRAGQLLDAMLAAIGRNRKSEQRGEAVYIANVVKCRPPNNRDPAPDEAAACRAYLDRQIALIRPKLILAVGRIAAQNLLGTEESLGKLRGAGLHDYHGTPVLITYHPAYLLRSPREKGKAWVDLKRARAFLGGAA
jgi:DNA polymerase